eukprot:Clim_evm14s2 gene=Clim_evmTU14s2
MEVYEAVGLGNAQAEIVAPVHGRRQVNLDFADEDSNEQPLAEVPAQGGLSSLDLPIEARVNSHRLKTKRHEMPSGWTDLGEVEDEENEQVKVIFALKNQNVAKLEATLQDVSNPKSPNYQQYLNVNEVADLVRPQQVHIDVVESWLQGFACDSISKNLAEDLITVHMSVGEAKKAFNAKFNYYRPPNQHSKIIRTLEYNVPDEVSAALSDVSGLMLVDYRPFKAQLSNPDDDRRRFAGTPGFNNPITPAAILSEYQITPSAPQVSKQAVASFFDGENDEFFSVSDLAQFQSMFDVTSNPIKKVIGPANDPSNPQDEANLDVQYITSSCQGCETWVFYQKDFFNLLEWANTVDESGDDAPKVLSMSYGFSESSSEWENMDAANVQFMKLGTTGRTVLVASGDSGVGCVGGKQDPSFPASSPYVTTVGGTDGSSEAWTGSGGGFSNEFSRMDYQNDHVNAYLDSSISLPPSRQFNNAGRAFPDLSAFSTFFEIILDGQSVLLDGTSCSTPTTAGIITLLNDVSIANGGSTLGFLNPLLYQMKTEAPNAFTDIVSGKNPDSPCSGFNAAPGWDPVTGLGTPNFPAMSAYVASIAQSTTASSRRSADLSF